MGRSALRGLDQLIGTWAIEIVFPANPSAVVRGETRFEWLAHGPFVIMRSNSEDGGPPASVSVIGRDDSVDGYTMLSSDSREVGANRIRSAAR
jgi:hypothetical protein